MPPSVLCSARAGWESWLPTTSVPAAPILFRFRYKDVHHVIKGNAVYELPFGPGKTFFNKGGLVGKIFGGWQISGLAQWRTGRPISFISGRGTVNRNANSGNNTANTTLTISQLQS